MFDQNNIWANVQMSGTPWDINWQLQDARYWRPFFGLMVRTAPALVCTVYSCAQPAAPPLLGLFYMCTYMYQTLLPCRD